MTKRISMWFLAGVIVATATVTFMVTLLFGGSLVDAEEGAVTTAVSTTVAAQTIAEPAEPTPKEVTDKVVQKVYELMAYYNNYYVGELDVDDLVHGVAEGIVAYSGDKYGSYYTKEELQRVMADYEGEFAGVGISVTYNSIYSGIEIITVFETGPAFKAGLLPNDLIIGVDGVDVGYLGYSAAIDAVRGKVGTNVTLTIARGENYKERFDVTLTRAIVEEVSVTYEEIKSEDVAQPIGYVRITTFNEHTPEQFRAAMGQGLTNDVHGLIVDLRNNGGGTLNSVVSMLDTVLPSGPIVRIQYKNGDETVYKSDMYKMTSRMPIIILVNGNTASAAELFTATLRDYGRAIILGETTYGKGTVQSIIQLSDGSGLRISTSLYAPAYSDNFEGKGIIPDIVVPMPDKYKNVNIFTLDKSEDVQLQAAINLYK